MNIFEALHRSIQTRPRPEDVAQLVLEALADTLTPGETKILDTAARYSYKRQASAYSSMAQDFARGVGAEKQISRASMIFAIPDPPSAEECLDIEVVEAFLKRIADSMQVALDCTSFKDNRLNRQQRKAAGIELQKRPYNKRFRMIRRLQQKLERMVANDKKYRATRLAKSGGAVRITIEDLAKDLNTACFVAYLSAKMSVRSVFTNAGQERAYDTIAEMLFKRAVAGTPNWWPMALLHVDKRVMNGLSDEEKGCLLGMWTETLHELADMLHNLTLKNDFDLKNCIVHKGNDSTTWNAVAGAWNKAREHWLAVLHALKMDHVIEHYCPGKVLRLMASDVVRWQVWSKIGYGKQFSWGDQEMIDQGLHPDTLVWRALPKPWEVFEGKALCPREEVAAVCAHVYASNPGMALGWTGAKPDKVAAAFKPTPELVHGVAISSPYLANVLRRAGWFSGKATKPVDAHVHVDRDHGFATKAHENRH